MPAIVGYTRTSEDQHSDRVDQPNASAHLVLSRLAWLMLVLMVATVGVSVGLLARALVRPRRRSPVVVRESPSFVIGPEYREVAEPTNGHTWLVTFGDYLCPPCRRAEDTLRQAIEESRVPVRRVFRHWPIEALHDGATLIAAASEAARLQGRFWQFHSAAMRLDPSSGAEGIERIAGSIGLDLVRFRKDCYGRGMARVAADRHDATLLGVRATPTHFLCEADRPCVRLWSAEDARGLLSR